MKMPATLPGLSRRHRNMRLLVAAGKRSRCYLPISSASFGSGACGCGAHAAPKTNSSSRRPVQVAYQLQLAPEEFKVWSQNLGHESILTTFSSYGPVTAYRQAEIMRRIATSGAEGAKPEEILSQIVALASRKNG